MNIQKFKSLNLLRKLFPLNSKIGVWVRIVYRMWLNEKNKARTEHQTNESQLHQLGEKNIASYSKWIFEFEQNNHKSEEVAFSNIYNNLFVSFIIPIYKPNLDHLDSLIDSLINQTSPEWEACLSYSILEKSDVIQYIENLCQKDKRFKVSKNNNYLGISENSNAALSIANGEFVGLIDQDDTISHNTVHEVIKCIIENPNCQIIYSDHDILNKNSSARENPLFKPDWSPDLMLSANYITHLTILHRDTVNKLGGFDKSKDGAQDWDLFFRMSEVISSDQIIHLPKVLYHWRDSDKSTATNIYAKPYALNAQLLSIQEHLTRIGLDSPSAFLDNSGFIRVKWNFNSSKKVSIIIPSKGAPEFLQNCINSILKYTDYSNYEIIIVNNGEEKPDQIPFYKTMASHPRIKVIHYDRPFNYSLANNFGVTHSDSEYLCFLNNDTEILENDWLTELVMWASREDVGAVGAKLIGQNQRIQHAGVILGLSGFAGHIFGNCHEAQWTIFGLPEWYRNYLAVTAACLVTKRSTFNKIGGFSETFELCGNDVEYGLRLREHGYRVVYNPFARLVHFEAATRDTRIPKNDFIISYKAYKKYLDSGDPYFNPNLSMWSLMPDLASLNEQHPSNFAAEFMQSLLEEK